MTKLDLWDALKPTMILQRVYCISPFQRVGNILKTSLTLSIYGLVSIILYYGLMVYAAYLINEIGNVLPFFQKSYLWAVIGGFEIFFNNAGLIVLLGLCEFKKNQKLSFLNRIYEIDESIRKVFRMGIPYKRLYLNNIAAIVLFFVYYEGLTAFVLYFLYGYGVTSAGLYLFAFLYQYEQICSGTMSLTYINCVFLLRERFRILKNIQIELTNASMTTNTKIHSQSNVVQVSKLFLTYKDLCSLIELANDNYGIMLIIRIAHDFTLTTSQVYLISWVVMDSSVTNKFELVACITLWMIQNVVKIGLTTLSAELTITEAHNCGRVLATHNRDSKGEQIQNMLESFDLWLLHRKIEFNANNFFKINLNLLYSIIGALATYALILIQFKQQEESLATDVLMGSSHNTSAT